MPGRSAGRGARRTREPGGHPEDHPGDPESVARALCLRQLTAAPRTRAQLADLLARRGVPGEVARRVLDRFAEVGLIDDATFAAAWVDSRHRGRGLGGRALSAELRRRGVDAATTAEAVATLDAETEEATARQLVRRRLQGMRGVDPPGQQRRLLGLLARKGYGAAMAYKVVREELREQGVDCGDPNEPADCDG